MKTVVMMKTSRVQLEDHSFRLGGVSGCCVTSGVAEAGRWGATPPPPPQTSADHRDEREPLRSPLLSLNLTVKPGSLTGQPVGARFTGFRGNVVSARPPHGPTAIDLPRLGQSSEQNFGFLDFKVEPAALQQIKRPPEAERRPEL